MSWRTVLISKPAKLDLRLGCLVVRDSESVRRIHLSEISVLIIENTASSVTAALLKELVNCKIKVIFCDERRNPISELTAYYGCHNCSLKLKKQLEWNDNIKCAVWTEIVKEKIKKQAQALELSGLGDSASMLYGYINEIEFNDETNREGHAAKVYFNSLFGKDFSRDDDNAINAALNYGYSLLLSCFNREVVSNGFLTQLGLFHDNMFNQYNLSCDLMEPFRPIVDLIIKDFLPSKFEVEEKREVLKLFGKELIIDGRKQSLVNAMKIYCKSVFDALENQDVYAIKFYSYDL